VYSNVGITMLYLFSRDNPAVPLPLTHYISTLMNTIKKKLKKKKKKKKKKKGSESGLLKKRKA